MYKGYSQSIICIVLACGLANGVLLLGQLLAWTAMVYDRSAEMGIDRAIISTIEGQELCEVCLVVVNETSRQHSEGEERIVDVFAKLLGEEDANVLIVTAPNARLFRYSLFEELIRREPTYLPLGPPPRFEV